MTLRGHAEGLRLSGIRVEEFYFFSTYSVDVSKASTYRSAMAGPEKVRAPTRRQPLNFLCITARGLVAPT